MEAASLVRRTIKYTPEAKPARIGPTIILSSNIF
jgi:hypothetical protein